MKAFRIIAIVLALMAAGCSSTADNATQISSTGSESMDGAGATTEDAAGSTANRDGATASEQAMDPDTHDEATAQTGSGDDGVERATDDDEAGRSADTVATGFLAQVSDATLKAATGRFEGRLLVVAAPGAAPAGDFELTLNGSYDLEADAFDITVDLSGLAAMAAADASPAEADMFASMFAEPVQVRSVGGTAWIRWSMLAGMFGAMTDDGGTAWIEAQTDEAASMTGQFGVDTPESPTDLLTALADMDATVTDVGRENIRGAETTHYEITIDLEAAAAGLPPGERAELEAELPGGVSGILPIEVWMDDDGLLRRLLVELDDLDAMGLDGAAGELASVLMEFEIFDVGEPIAIEPPPADQVITTDELGFNLGGDL